MENFDALCRLLVNLQQQLQQQHAHISCLEAVVDTVLTNLSEQDGQLQLLNAIPSELQNTLQQQVDHHTNLAAKLKELMASLHVQQVTGTATASSCPTTSSSHHSQPPPPSLPRPPPSQTPYQNPYQLLLAGLDTYAPNAALQIVSLLPPTSRRPLLGTCRSGRDLSRQQATKLCICPYPPYLPPSDPAAAYPHVTTLCIARGACLDTPQDGTRCSNGLLHLAKTCPTLLSQCTLLQIDSRYILPSRSGFRNMGSWKQLLSRCCSLATIEIIEIVGGTAMLRLQPPRPELLPTGPEVPDEPSIPGSSTVASSQQGSLQDVFSGGPSRLSDALSQRSFASCLTSLIVVIPSSTFKLPGLFLASNLQQLHLCGDRMVFFSDFLSARPTAHLPHLTALSMPDHRWKGNDTNSLFEFLGQLPKLQDLCLNPDAFPTTLHLPHLTKLNFKLEYMREEALIGIRNLTRLEQLWLREIPVRGETSFQDILLQLPYLPTLQQLGVADLSVRFTSQPRNSSILVPALEHLVLIDNVTAPTFCSSSPQQVQPRGRVKQTARRQPGKVLRCIDVARRAILAPKLTVLDGGLTFTELLSLVGQSPDLDLRECGRLKVQMKGAEDLTTAAEQMPSLFRYPGLKLWEMDTDELVQALCKIGSQLHELELVDGDVWDLGDKGLTAIARNCPGLRKLTLDAATNAGFTKKGVGAFGGVGLAQLRHLVLCGCKGLDNWSFAQLVRGCPKLECLKVDGVSKVSEQGLLVPLLELEGWGPRVLVLRGGNGLTEEGRLRLVRAGWEVEERDQVWTAS